MFTVRVKGHVYVGIRDKAEEIFEHENIIQQLRTGFGT
jgi:hypothetical protein